MAENVTEEQLRILRHMLGLREVAERGREPYRNRYVAPKGDTELAEMATAGLVRLGGSIEKLCPDFDLYHATELGVRLARSSVKIETRSQQRYRRYLNFRDVYPDVSFGDFLRGNFEARA